MWAALLAWLPGPGPALAHWRWEVGLPRALTAFLQLFILVWPPSSFLPQLGFAGHGVLYRSPFLAVDSPVRRHSDGVGLLDLGLGSGSRKSQAL